MSRILPLEKRTLPVELQAIVEGLEKSPGDSSLARVMEVLARCPELPQQLAALDNTVRNSLKLAPQLRELAVLQLLRLHRCESGFQKAMASAKSAGLNDKQIANVGAYRSYPYYSDKERLVLEYSEVVTRELAVSDELFERLQQHLSEREIVELTMVIAYWNMVSRLLVPLGCER